MKPKQLTDYLDSYSDVIDSISVMSMDQTVPFIESSYKGINFDKVKEEYCKKHKIKDSQSNDSVISFNGQDYFVEFKSTENPKSKDLYGKIRDSLLIYIDIIDEKLSIVRENLGYILVYKKNIEYYKFSNKIKNLAKDNNSNAHRDVCNIKKACTGVYFNDVQFMSPQEFINALKNEEK
ncbi:hypothetical protein HMPREF2800_07280 [Anaerosphaera sp. HMSC064C01]|nr:hypothetical protein HMPREF2800_07280 [Anaerosphaera sp. HMSC064C01]